MPINVESYDGGSFAYSDGTKWVIDDNGLLHVIGSAGNIASFNTDRWTSVQHG